MIMMTAVHLWLLAPSLRATLQRFLKRLPAAVEWHTDCMAKCFLGGFNQCHLHMLDKSNPHQGGGSPPEAPSCPFVALSPLLNDPSTPLTLPWSFQSAPPRRGRSSAPRPGNSTITGFQVNDNTWIFPPESLASLAHSALLCSAQARPPACFPGCCQGS